MQRSRSVTELSASSVQQQFKLLFQCPFEGILDLATERSIVVIIDELNESNITEEMLTSLFQEFSFLHLPFV